LVVKEDPVQDKVVIVTGASRGIGRATALAMAAAGARVVIAARTAPQLHALAEEIEAQTGRPALVSVTDVALEEDVRRMVAEAHEAFGRVDVLVNNAGFNTRKCKIWEVETDEWDAMFAVNLRGAFLCCREVLPGMIARRSGQIINVISTASQIGLEDMGAYAATKWGLLGLTKSLIKEARPYNIRVTAFSPGGTDTTFRAEPRPHYLAPDTVAEAILYVASLPENAVVHDLVLRPIVETNF
jgi:NAD(P)-dependent dehydrogenase (short-subunit alcohol dehydrogenase family)